MSRSRTTPLGAVAKGLVAGAIGTGVMTAYQLAAAKAMGSGSSNVPGEVGTRASRPQPRDADPRSRA